jgi:hypothetical protein
LRGRRESALSKLGGLPVIDDDSQGIGMVSRNDPMQAIAFP